MPSIDDKLMEVHFSSISERVVDIGAHRPRRGEYCVLMAQLPGQHKEAIGVLRLDPEHDSLYVQLRRDWRSIAGQDDVEVLEALGSDLELKAGEMGGEAVLAHLESQASWTVQLPPATMSPSPTSNEPCGVYIANTSPPLSNPFARTCPCTRLRSRRDPSARTRMTSPPGMARDAHRFGDRREHVHRDHPRPFHGAPNPGRQPLRFSL